MIRSLSRADSTFRADRHGRPPAVAPLIAVVLAVALVLFAAAPAAATWSVVAVDPESGEVGVAMASCSSAAALGESDEVLAPIVLVPGVGAGVVQGTIRPAAIDEMAMLIGEPGVSAPVVVEALLVAEQDPSLVSVRQYGVVQLGDDGNDIGLHVGDDNGPSALAIGSSDVTVQAVHTVDSAVGEQTLAAYTAARRDGESLSGALVSALEAGAKAGGDVECGTQRALFAQLAVVSRTDEDGRSPTMLLTVTVDEDDGQNPVELLGQAFREDQQGWINAGTRSPTFIPRWAVLVVGLFLTAASVLVIRRGMRMG